MDSEIISRSAVPIMGPFAQERGACTTIVFRCVEFTLRLLRAAWGSDIEQYDIYVNVAAGVVPATSVTVVQAFRALEQRMYSYFAERMLSLAPKAQELRTLRDAADCVKFTLIKDPDGGIEVTGQSRGPSYHLLPVSKRPALEALADRVKKVKADEVVFHQPQQPDIHVDRRSLSVLWV